MVGTPWMAAEFSTRVTSYTSPERGWTGVPVAQALLEGDRYYSLPDDYVIDYSGALVANPSKYSAPDRWVGYDGVTTFQSPSHTLDNHSSSA